jgi:hypothetical protein
LDVKKKKNNGDSKKTEDCIEGVDGGEYREDFFNVKSPEDINEKDDSNNG